MHMESFWHWKGEKNDLSLPLAVYLAWRLAGTKQIRETNNPNWPEANQLAIYKVNQGGEPETTQKKKNQLVARAEFELGVTTLKCSALNHSASLFHNYIIKTFN